MVRIAQNRNPRRNRLGWFCNTCCTVILRYCFALNQARMKLYGAYNYVSIHGHVFITKLKSITNIRLETMNLPNMYTITSGEQDSVHKQARRANQQPWQLSCLSPALARFRISCYWTTSPLSRSLERAILPIADRWTITEIRRSFCADVFPTNNCPSVNFLFFIFLRIALIVKT